MGEIIISCILDREIIFVYNLIVKVEDGLFRVYKFLLIVIMFVVVYILDENDNGLIFN